MNDRRLSYLISWALHLFIIALFLFFTYEAPLHNIPRNFQIVGVFSGGISGKKSIKKGLANNYVPKKINLPKSISKSLHKKINSSPKKILAKNKIVAKEEIGNTISNLSPKPSAPVLSQSEKQISDQEFFQQFAKELKKQESNQNYQLEGEVTNRKIVAKILPKYPKGLKQNAKVKLRFTLSPQGKVSNIVIVKRANPLLEKVSTQSLLKWKFNPILSKKNQVGFITFVYQIK